MQNPTSIEDPKLRRFAHDFEALADLLHHLVDHDRLAPSPRQTVAEREMDFTTEWQMVSTVEQVHSD